LLTFSLFVRKVIQYRSYAMCFLSIHVCMSLRSSK